MIGSDRFRIMLGTLCLSVLGLMFMIAGFAAGLESNGSSGTAAAAVVIGLCAVVAFGLKAVYEAVQYGFALGAAGRELPKLAKLPSAAAEKSASAS